MRSSSRPEIRAKEMITANERANAAARGIGRRVQPGIAVRRPSKYLMDGIVQACTIRPISIHPIVTHEGQSDPEHEAVLPTRSVSPCW
jgi:hypothetical protein